MFAEEGGGGIFYPIIPAAPENKIITHFLVYMSSAELCMTSYPLCLGGQTLSVWVRYPVWGQTPVMDGVLGSFIMHLRCNGSESNTVDNKTLGR